MNTKNPLFVGVIVVLVAAAGFYKLVLGPKRKDASDTKAQVTAAQDKLDQARLLLASNQQARQSYKADYASVVRLGKAVPGDDDVRSLVVQLDQAAKATRIDFQSIDVGGSGSGSSSSGADAGSGQLPPGATVGPAGFPLIPFSFTFKGGFFRLSAFFAKLDDFVKASNAKISVTGRLLTVDGVKLEPDTTGFPNVKATVEASSYLVNPVEGATGGATAAGPDAATAAAGATSAASSSKGGSSVPTTSATSTGVIR